MSFDDIQRAAAALPPLERRRLMGYLVTLNTTEEERRVLRQKIDDKDPSRWLTLEQLDEKLREFDERDARES